MQLRLVHCGGSTHPIPSQPIPAHLSPSQPISAHLIPCGRCGCVGVRLRNFRRGLVCVGTAFACLLPLVQLASKVVAVGSPLLASAALLNQLWTYT